mgnify:CR=1 FL=1
MSNTATAYEVGHLYEVDPAALRIGANIRTDTHPDAKEFAASIKTRGVLEVISAYLAPEGGLTVLRGQRRTVVAGGRRVTRYFVRIFIHAVILHSAIKSVLLWHFLPRL